MEAKIKYLILVVVLIGLLTTSVSAKQISQDVFNGYSVLSITGNESVIFGNNGIIIDDTGENISICLNPQVPDGFQRQEEDCNMWNPLGQCLNGTNSTVTYNYPAYIDMKKPIKNETFLKRIMKNSDKYCTNVLNPLLNLSLKFGEESILIQGDASYSSTDYNITQETGFAHLNLSNKSIMVYFPFDANTSSTVTYDYSRFDNDGTVNTALHTGSGYIGGAYAFAGADDHIAIADDPTVNPPNRMSMSLWIYPTNTAASLYIIDKGTATCGGGRQYAIRQDPGGSITFYLCVSGGTQGGITSDATVTINKWNHVVTTYNGTNSTIYINGNRSSVFDDVSGTDPVSGTIGIDTNPLYIGGLAATVLNYEGSVDEFMIYNESLTPEDVNLLFYNQSKKFADKGNMDFMNLDLGTNSTVNITLNNCSTLINTTLNLTINGKETCVLNNCKANECNIRGLSEDTTLSIEFGASPYNFYSPSIINNITLDGYRFAAPYTPYGELRIPLENATRYTHAGVFNCFAEDDTALANVTLMLQSGGDWYSNHTVQLLNITNTTYLGAHLPNGLYNWSCNITDGTNWNYATENRSLLINYTACDNSTGDHLVISEVYAGSTGNTGDDYVELYNPTNAEIDLSGYRLEMATGTSRCQNPGIAMTFGDTNGTASTNTLFKSPKNIPAHGYYLIANNDANASTVEKADAVSYRSTFSMTYTTRVIYLATSTVSDCNDPDIVDMIGYDGDVFDFEGVDHADALGAGIAMERRSDFINNETGGNGYDTDQSYFDFIISNSDMQNRSDVAEVCSPPPPPLPNANIDLLFAASTTPTTYDDFFNEGEDFYVYINWTDGTTNIPLNQTVGLCNMSLFNGLEESEGFDDNFTICGTGCDYGIYNDTFEFSSTTNAVTDIGRAEICNVFLQQQDVIVNVSCNSGWYAENRSGAGIPLCVLGTAFVTLNTSICVSELEVNLTVSYPGTFQRRKRVVNLAMDREYSEHIIEYPSEMLFNTTLGLWRTNFTHEYYDHGLKNISANCSSVTSPGYDNSTLKQITIENIPPSIMFGQVNYSIGTFNITNNMVLEYGNNGWDWSIAITDDDIYNITYAFYNGSGSVIQTNSTNSPFNPYPTFEKAFFNFSNPYNLTVIVNDTFSNVTTASILFNVTDTLTPRFNGTILNRTNELGSAFAYDINASDIHSINAFAVNDSDNFSIDVTGLLANNSFLSFGLHWLEITVNDTSGNTNTTVMFVNISDNFSPTFDHTITNQTSELGTIFIYDINASDYSGIDVFVVNNTANFTINNSGYLTNASFLNLGLFWLNVSLNDTNGFGNSTMFFVNVTDTTPPTFDPALQNQTINFTDFFVYDINATDLSGIDTVEINWTANFTIDASGIITNITILQIRNYSINVTINDTFGNTQRGKFNLEVLYENLKPIVNLLTPTNFETFFPPYNITFAASDPNNDTLNISLFLFTGATLNNTIEINMNQTNTSKYWNGTYQNGNYNMTLVACELDTVELYCVNDSHTVTITDTLNLTIRYHHNDWIKLGFI